MSDSVTKYHEMKYYFDEEFLAKKKINNKLTKNQALQILNNVILHCKKETELVESVVEVKEYIRNVGL